LEAVIVKALAKRPEDRYQTAADFAEALRPFAGAAGQAIPRSRPASALAAVEPEAKAVGDALAEPARSRPSTGVLFGVAATCLALGVVLAVLVMRVLGR
jgi:serine/threonine-protein kinase